MKAKTSKIVLLLSISMLVSNWASAQLSGTFVEYELVGENAYGFSSNLEPPKPLNPKQEASWGYFWIFGNGNYSLMDTSVQEFPVISPSHTVFCEATPLYSKPSTATETTSDNLAISAFTSISESKNQPDDFIDILPSRAPKEGDLRVIVVSYKNQTSDVHTNIPLRLFFNTNQTTLVEDDEVFLKENTSFSDGVKTFNDEYMAGNSLIVHLWGNSTFDSKIDLIIPSLDPAESFNIYFRFYTDPVYGVEMLSLMADILIDGKRHSAELDEPLVYSYDPNKKEADKEEIEGSNIINEPEYITYTIEFQNLGNGPATSVVVADRISTLLDISTYNFLGSKHDGCIQEDPFRRRFVWHFDDIYLPGLNQQFDSLFPNSNPGENAAFVEATKGWLKFEIATFKHAYYLPIALGTGLPYVDIINSADIMFDDNMPGIITTSDDSIRISITPFDKSFNNGENTNSITNAYKEQLSVKSIYPNPCSEDVVIKMELAGEMQNCKTEIIDLTGRVLITKEKFNSYEGPNPMVMSLNTSILPAGVYFIRVVYGDNAVVNKLIKR